MAPGISATPARADRPHVVHPFEAHLQDGARESHRGGQPPARGTTAPARGKNHEERSKRLGGKDAGRTVPRKRCHEKQQTTFERGGSHLGQGASIEEHGED